MDEVVKIEKQITQLQQLKTPFYNEMADIRLAQLKVFAEDNGHDFDELAVGTWDCQDSPTGACIYNNEYDPMWDECLVCGDPDERK